MAAEPLEAVALAAGSGIPGDRAFAIARGGTAWDDGRPQWLRKEAFVMLMRDGDEVLARVACAWRSGGRAATVDVPGAPPLDVDLGTAAGRGAMAAALNAYLGGRSDGPVRVVEAGPLSLTDIPQNGLSLVNLASVADFAERIGRPVDPLRFRANLYLDGLPPWIERTWPGRTVRVGAATLVIAAHIQRCSAIRVDPATAMRDLDALRLLRAHYGHLDMGVYADVRTGGRVAVGDAVVPDPAPGRPLAATKLGRAAFYARNAWALLRSRLAR
jgi:hypothetical protein